MFMCTSSSASLQAKPPDSISAAMAARPFLIAASSSAEMMPTWASMAAWAREPRMSCRHIFRSKPMEALMACMMAEGPSAKRPPHCWLAPVVLGMLKGSVRPCR